MKTFLGVTFGWISKICTTFCFIKYLLEDKNIFKKMWGVHIWYINSIIMLKPCFILSRKLLQLLPWPHDQVVPAKKYDLRYLWLDYQLERTILTHAMHCYANYVIVLVKLLYAQCTLFDGSMTWYGEATIRFFAITMVWRFV